MKKILALILAGCMVLSMAACGGSETAAPTEENTATTEETKEEAPYVVLSRQKIVLKLTL